MSKGPRRGWTTCNIWAPKVRRYHVIRSSGYMQSRDFQPRERQSRFWAWLPKSKFKDRHRFLERISFTSEPIHLPNYLVETLQRIKPSVLIADDLSEDGEFIRPRGTFAKMRRASPAIAMHQLIKADPDVFRVYTDASERNGHTGAAAWMPSVQQRRAASPLAMWKLVD